MCHTMQAISSAQPRTTTPSISIAFAYSSNGQSVGSQFSNSLGACACGGCGGAGCPCCGGGQTATAGQGPGGNLQTGGKCDKGAHACSVGMQGCDAVHCKYACDGFPVTPGAPWNQQGSGGASAQAGVTPDGQAFAGAQAGGGGNMFSGIPNFGGNQFGSQPGGNCGGGQDQMAQLVMVLLRMLSGGGMQNNFGGGGPFNFGRNFV